MTYPKKPKPHPTYTECTCDATGLFFSGGAVVNGKYTGTAGVCFRCQGKGWQSPKDVKRNAYYDNRIRRVPL